MFNHGRSEINHVLRSSWIGAVVRFAGVPIAVQVDVFAAQAIQQLRHGRTGNGVPAIHGHVDRPCQRTGGLEDGFEVGVEMRMVHHLAIALCELAIEEHALELLNFFTRQRQGATAHLESVVCRHGQMAGGDHDASVDGQGPAGVVDASGGNDAQIQHLDTAIRQPTHQFGGQRGGGVTNVTTHGERIAFEVGGDGSTKAVSERRGEFTRAVTAGKSSNVVGFETGFRPCRHGFHQVEHGFQDSLFWRPNDPSTAP